MQSGDQAPGSASRMPPRIPGEPAKPVERYSGHHAQSSSELNKLCLAKCLCENVSNHLIGWDKAVAQLAAPHSLTHKVMHNIDVLRAWSVKRIPDELESRLIVDTNDNSIR